MPSSTPLSYQTTMPEYPDVSYDAYQADLYGATPGVEHQFPNRLSTSIYAWMTGKPDYATWRANNLDQYNASMSAYNTWLQSPQGSRQNLEQAGYNASYYSGSQASASPLSYENVSPSSGGKEMAQGISGIIQFVAALYGLKLQGAQLAGMQLNNQKQQIENSFLSRILKNRAALLGYQANEKRFAGETELASRFGADYEDLMGSIIGTEFGDYNIAGARQGFGYQKAFQDIQKLQASTDLLRIQKTIASWNEKEKQYYVQVMQDLEKQMLEGRIRYIGGQADLNDIEIGIQKKFRELGASSEVVRTAIEVLRLIFK